MCRDSRCGLLGVVEALIDVNKHLAPVERVAYERDVASVRARLVEETFAVAWTQGRGMFQSKPWLHRNGPFLPNPFLGCPSLMGRRHWHRSQPILLA